MKRHSQAWSAIALTIVLLGVAVPSSMGATQPPAAMSGTLPGGGYAAVKLNYAGGGPVDLSIATEGCEAGCAFGGTMIAPDGSQLASVLIAWGPVGSEDCVLVRSPDLGQDTNTCHASQAQHLYFEAVRHVGGSSHIEFWNEIDSNRWGDAPGVWTLLVWMAFKSNQQSATSWKLSFNPGVASIVGIETGDRAWYASASDFGGGTGLVLSQSGAFVSAHAGSRLGLSVENRLIGLMTTDFFGTATAVGGLTFRGPDFTRTCSCWLWNATGPNSVPPGSYELNLTRAAAGHQGWTDVQIILVDPRLPR